ncbi:hypothetical protein EG329_008498 [Mollisiaceae sp. DMI_Dod_QoI]|nr:hypothetical protein EG329_008498 [Helotiales sp. DMI_Dod_QoI]
MAVNSAAKAAMQKGRVEKAKSKKAKKEAARARAAVAREARFGKKGGAAKASPKNCTSLRIPALLGSYPNIWFPKLKSLRFEINDPLQSEELSRLLKWWLVSPSSVAKLTICFAEFNERAIRHHGVIANRSGAMQQLVQECSSRFQAKGSMEDRDDRGSTTWFWKSEVGDRLRWRAEN